MGATYTRQSSSAIVDGGIIEAADINAEFNQILAAFAVTSGHTHDGTTAEGGPITKLLGTAITIGDATAGTDIAVTFDGETADGVLTWMEDEDYFKFSDDILMNSTERLNFGDTGTYIFQSTDGQLDIVADTEVQIAATTIDINGAVDISGALTLAGTTLAETISDTVGAMVSSNTETGITVSYEDGDNTLDFALGAAQTTITSLFATDIKIGEDNETKIDFETANEIHLYAANAEQVYVADGVFGPQTDSDVDLGTTGVRWKDAFVDSVTVTDNVTIGGNLTVNGTTTTVNSTTVTIDDPIFTLGGDTAPSSDDNKDRGIEFRYHTGSAAKVGFFGYDDSAGAFTFIPDATNSSEVFSGTAGNVAFGNIAGTLTTAAQTNITSVGALDGGSITSGFGAIDNGTSGIRTNTFTAETSIVPDASGGADIGSTSLEWGDLYIADDKKIYLGSDQDVSIEYDEDGNDTTAVVAAGGISFAPHGTGTGNGTELRFQELAANGANYVGFKAPDAISSNEVWVLPNADGSADQVLKTDGSNTLSWADAGGGGTVDMVADGDIAIRKPVIRTAAGKAKQIAETTTVASDPSTKLADLDGSDTTNSTVMTAYEPTSGKFVMLYKDTSNSSYPTIVAGTWDDNNTGSITWGTPEVLNSAASIGSGLAVTAGNGRIHATYQAGSAGSGNLNLRTATIGSDLTFSGFSTAVDTFGEDQSGTYSGTIQLAFDTSTNYLIATYSDATDGTGNFYAIPIHINGTTYTTGSASTICSGNPANYRVGLVFDPDTNRTILAYKDNSNSGYTTVNVIQSAGTSGSPSLTVGSDVVVDSGDAGGTTSLTYDTTNNKVFLAYENSADTELKGAIGTVNSGTNSISFTTPASIKNTSADYEYFDMVYFEDQNKIYFVYKDKDDGDDLTYLLITPGASSFSVGSAVEVSANEHEVRPGSASAGVGKGVLFGLQDSDDSSKVAYLSFYNASTTTTVLTKANYLGVSAAAISDGATGKIVIPGGISEGHSSLTVGSRLFTNGAGTIGLAGNARGFEFIGKAISATQIQLQDREFEFYAEADGAVTKGAPIDVASGKIKAIVGNSIGLGSATTLSGTNTTQQLDSVYDTGSDRTVVIYKDTANSNYGTAVVLQSGTDSVTAGTPVVFHSGVTTVAQYQSPNSIVYDPDTNRIIVLFVGPSDYLYSVVGSITAGTNASSWGSVQTIDSSKGYQSPAISYDLGVDRVLIMGRQQTNSGKIGSWVGTVNGGTTNNITLGSEAYMEGSGDSKRIFGVLYDTTNDKHIINYSNYSNSSVRFTVATVTGGTTNTVAWVTTDAFAGGSGGYDNVRNGCISFDPDRTTSGETVFAYVWSAANDSNKTQAARVNVTSTGASASTLRKSTIIEPGHDNLPEGYGGMDLTYDTSTDTHVYAAGNADGLKLAAFTLTGDGGVTGAITVSGFTDNVMTAAAQTSGATLAFDSDTNKMILSYQDEDNDYAKAKMITSPAVASTKANFDGFAQFAASDGNIVAAKLDYSIDTNQSGLTAGSTYYLDDETALTTTSSGNQKVGVALTDTDLQIVKT